MINPRFVYQDQAEAQEACDVWKKILKLADWDIVVRIGRASQMSTLDRMGQVSYTLNKRSAVITLLDPEDYSNSIWPLDHELTLVHELVHLHLVFTDPFIDSHNALNTLLEQAVESLSAALVGLNRLRRENQSR